MLQHTPKNFQLYLQQSVVAIKLLLKVLTLFCAELCYHQKCCITYGSDGITAHTINKMLKVLILLHKMHNRDEY